MVLLVERSALLVERSVLLVERSVLLVERSVLLRLFSRTEGSTKEEETEKEDQEKGSSHSTSSGAVSAPDTATKLATFRHDCETFIDEQLQARLVMLTADGTHGELVNAVTSSRLYTNLANSG